MSCAHFRGFVSRSSGYSPVCKSLIPRRSMLASIALATALVVAPPHGPTTVVARSSAIVARELSFVADLEVKTEPFAQGAKPVGEWLATEEALKTLMSQAESSIRLDNGPPGAAAQVWLLASFVMPSMHVITLSVHALLDAALGGRDADPVPRHGGAIGDINGHCDRRCGTSAVHLIRRVEDCVRGWATVGAGASVEDW